MTQWNFYLSGILYGVLEEESGRIFHRPMDVHTSTLAPREELDAENTWYLKLGRMDVRRALLSRTFCEEQIRAGQDAFVTQEGDHFLRRDSSSYTQRQIKFPRDLVIEDGRILAFVTPYRDQCAVLVQAGMEERTILASWRQKYPDTPLTVQPCQSVMVPMKDGTLLATDVYLPGGNGPFPTVLVRTPYGKGNDVAPYYRFVQRGYAMVIQDVRGREDSQGQWLPMCYEREDGSDTLDWIAAQPWSTGSVAMTGGSYLGYVQWAAAASGNPHLKAMLSSVCSGSPFVDIPRRGGCFNSGALAWAFAVSQQRTDPSLMVRDDWDQVMEIRPLRDLPRKATGHDIPFLTTWLDHMDYDEMWDACNWKSHTAQAKVPALIMSGWFDDNGMGTTEALELCSSLEDQKVVLGPWIHSGNASYDLHGFALGSNALRYDMDLLCLDWLEHYLKGVDNGVERGPRVEYYTTGSNCWKTAQHWPVENSREVTLYLDGENDGDAVKNQGLLVPAPPEAPVVDTFRYDPENPATHIVDLSENELEVPSDYTQEELRPDILCYTTAPLQEDLTITGDATVLVYLSSDCVDTDLVVRITDVSESGLSRKLADGVLSARYRHRFDQPELMVPGEVYPISIRTTKLSHTFKRGHQLRLTITSSAKNFIFPNRNMGQGFDGVASKVAENSIHHGGAYPSQVTLRQEL